MRIGGGLIGEVNVLFSESGNLRHRDSVVERGDAFWIGVDVPAVAAQLSLVQLFNPVGSGVMGIVDKIYIQTPFTGIIQVLDWPFEITTAVGAWGSKKLGEPLGSMMLRTDNLALPVGTERMHIGVSTLVSPVIELPYPILIDEDNGLLVQHSTVNLDLTVSFMGREA